MGVKTFIISGFLGSGKTELVRQFINQNEDKRIVIIENEVAEFGIDGKVSSAGNVKVIEINDGSVSDVNLRNLDRVVKRSLKEFNPDIIILEASGAAALDNILCMMRTYKNMKVYGITVVDAERFSKAKKLSTHTLEHIARASAVILNKCDLISIEVRKKQVKNIKMLNKNVVETTNSVLDLSKLKLPALDLKKAKKKAIPNYMLWKIKNNLGIKQSKSEGHANINAYVYEVFGTISLKHLKRFFAKYQFPRSKGFIYLQDKKLYYFNVISNHFYIIEAPKQHKKQGELNRIVLIGQNVYSRRGKFRGLLNKCVGKSIYNKLQNLFWVLKNQQRVPERVVYL